MKIRDLLEERRAQNWPMGACSLFTEIEDYSGTCGRCGWSVEDHEYLNAECIHPTRRMVHDNRYECKECGEVMAL